VLEAKPPLSRRERRRREVHRRILDAAVELFDTRGVEDTRIDDICERADLAQKTFFNHFPTKQHLFREIAQAFIGNVCTLVEEARKRPGSTAERLTDVFRRAGDVARQRGPRHRELVQEVMRISAAEAIAPPHEGGLPEAFHALLRDGLEVGDVTRLQAPIFLTEMIVSVLQGVVLRWAHDEHYSIEQHLEEAASFLCRAIASDRRGPLVARIGFEKGGF
jgi:AcrR family transcriptional regulator